MTSSVVPFPQGVPTIRLASPSAAIGAIPHLVGFPPERSVVVLMVDNGLLSMTARVDLPDPGHHPREWCRALVSRLRHSRGAEAIAVVYPAGSIVSGACLPWADLVQSLQAALARRGTRLVDALVTADDRWWSYLCHDRGCCPAEGRPVTTDEASLVRSELVYAGLAPVANRQALAAEFVSGDVPAADTHDGGRSERTSAERAALATRASALLSTAADVTDSDIVTVREALDDIRIRDAVLWDMTHGNDLGAWRRAATTLHRCLRMTARPVAAPVATVLAITHWQLGDGARAVEALRLAMAADAHYRLARLVLSAVTAGLPPQSWSQVMQDLDRAQCLGEETQTLHRTA